jgi:thioredoxin 1
MATIDTPIITNDQSIERVLGARLPVAILFLDGKPDASLAQAMDRSAKEDAGELLVTQVQVKDNPVTVRRYQVERTPLLVTVRRGQELSRERDVSGSSFERHVAYLMGKGPRPETVRQPDSAPGYRTPSEPAQGDGRVVAATDATFDREVFRSPQPVLVDFWAPWCGPCRMTDPILVKLAREKAGKLRVVKVNVDENPLTAQTYGVQSIPTMLLVKGGKIVDRWVGALPEPALRSRLATHVQ